MSLPPPHRKRIKHFDHPGHARELTFSCYQRQPLLNDPPVLDLLTEAINRAMIGQGFNLCAFVFMPEHVHLIVFPARPDAMVSPLLKAIKGPHSFRTKRWMESQNDPRLVELTIRDRPGHESFRFWQEGPGYDRNIDTASDLRTAVDYLHDNPLRRGLCQRPEQWKWSSWHHYHGVPDSRAGLPTVHGLPEGELLE